MTEEGFEICLEEKVKLKALPCHPDHLFCLPCLEQNRQGRQEFECPQCKTKTLLVKGKTAASLESRYFGFMKCKVCGLTKRTDRFRWCVECRAYLCAQCVERDEHWAEKHTTSPFHALAGLRAATALISEREEAMDSLDERIEEFSQSLSSRLKKRLGSNQRSAKHGAKLRATFDLRNKSSSGGLSGEEAAAIANSALEMVGETGDALPLAAPVRMPRVEEAETWVLDAIANTASHSTSPHAAAASSLQPAIRPVPATVAAPPNPALSDHPRPETPARPTATRPTAGASTSEATAEASEARLVIMERRRVEIFYPFSTTPSLMRTFNELPSGGCYGATAVSEGRQILITGGLDDGLVPTGGCWILDNSNRIRAAAPVPLEQGLFDHACATLGDTAYVVGAGDDNGGGKKCLQWREGVWSPIPDLPHEVNDVSAASMAATRSLYVMGDRNYRPLFLRYKVDDNRWTELRPPPCYYGRNSLAVLGEEVYALGQWGSPQAVHVYREDSGQWSTGPPIPSCFNSLVTLDNRLLALESGLGSQKKIRVLEPRSQAWRLLEKRQQNDFDFPDYLVPLPPC